MSAVSSSLSPRSATSARSLELLQRRTMRVLVAAQLLGALGLAAGGTAGALLAEHLTGSATAAGLPLRCWCSARGSPRWSSPASWTTQRSVKAIPD
jgi:hypothetical protein